jgi:hypothetical protein
VLCHTKKPYRRSRGGQKAVRKSKDFNLSIEIAEIHEKPVRSTKNPSSSRKKNRVVWMRPKEGGELGVIRE